MIKIVAMFKPTPAVSSSLSPSISRWRVCVAPMLDWTDRHCRFFHRILSPSARLYTEMVTTGALLHGDRPRHLDFSPQENPLALQLGGSDPADLAACARMGAEWGYDEINLNCGCPSDRVQKGRFGACLMKEPALVADCVAAMVAGAPSLPITVKCRIGVDDFDSLDFLLDFIRAVREAGAAAVILHARKAWLSGLSPKENREIPPLRYDVAAQVKGAFPDLPLVLNGGLSTVLQVQDALQTFDGVMIGREAYQNPYLLAELESALYGTPRPERADVARAMIPYAARMMTENGAPLHAITRHMLGLYHGRPRARTFRRLLTEGTQVPGVWATLIDDAVHAVTLQSSPAVPE